MDCKYFSKIKKFHQKMEKYFYRLIFFQTRVQTSHGILKIPQNLHPISHQQTLNLAAKAFDWDSLEKFFQFFL